MATKKQKEWEANTAPRPFEEISFVEVWLKLLGMPKWKKKPLSAIEMASTRLKRFDSEFATTLVEAAIEGNYQGVVFPDSTKRFEIYKQQKDGTTAHKSNSSDGNRKLGTSEARINTAKNW